MIRGIRVGKRFFLFLFLFPLENLDSETEKGN